MGANSNKKRNVPFKEQFRKINPITKNQTLAFEEWDKGQNLILHGFAGTGKTLSAMSLALNDLLTGKIGHIIIVRSALPTQDIGFLPGSYEEKIAPYEEPYDSICDFLFKTKNNYDELKDRGFVTFMPLSFIRGITFDNSIIILDEAQNASFHQIDSVITRLGENSRIIMCGDYTQSDIKKSSEKHDVVKIMSILENLDQFSRIEFGEQDIVRSQLVKSYIIEKHKQGFM